MLSQVLDPLDAPVQRANDAAKVPAMLPDKVRYERRADIHQAFLSLGCALICWKA